MPPPMPNPSKRMTAQTARPVQRYRPGKPAAKEESSDEDEESEVENQHQQRKKVQARPQPAKPRPKAAEEDEDDDDEDDFVTDPEDDGDGGVSVEQPEPGLPTASSTTIVRRPAAPPEGSESEEESEEESDSASEASSSSEDEPQRKFQRPTFIKKSDRNNSTTANGTSPAPTLETPAPEDDHARRMLQTENLIADRIQRDALARAAGRKGWDDDDDAFAPEDLVDDTDGLDPEAEHQAWRLRELQRLKRDREAMIAREKEIEELERRRNLTAGEREKEDQDFLSKQKEERDENRTQSGFLARYHHKGAFFQDDEAAEILKKRDVMGAKFVDEVSDKSALPEYMRIRDMNKLGKKGRTRYKDLRNEDTGRYGEDIKRWRGAGDNRGRGGEEGDMRGVDERFLPDRDGGGPTASGANASAVGNRKVRYRSQSRETSPKRRDDGDSYRPRRRSYSYSRSRSRSRSPPRRKRSASPPRRRDRDEDEGSKRRRLVDAT